MNWSGLRNRPVPWFRWEIGQDPVGGCHLHRASSPSNSRQWQRTYIPLLGNLRSPLCPPFSCTAIDWKTPNRKSQMKEENRCQHFGRGTDELSSGVHLEKCRCPPWLGHRRWHNKLWRCEIHCLQIHYALVRAQIGQRTIALSSLRVFSLFMIVQFDILLSFIRRRAKIQWINFLEDYNHADNSIVSWRVHRLRLWVSVGWAEGCARLVVCISVSFVFSDPIFWGKFWSKSNCGKIFWPI